MATIVITHEVEDVRHWLSSPKRAEVFAALGYTVRTFIDPTNEHGVGLILEGPGLDGIRQLMEADEGKQAMKFDGVRPDTIRTYIESSAA